jgi:hypothetical protein
VIAKTFFDVSFMLGKLIRNLFGGNMTLKIVIGKIYPPKSNSLHQTTSNKPSCVEMGLPVRRDMCANGRKKIKRISSVMRYL